MKIKFSMEDLFQRLIWAAIGYFTSLFGIVNIPGTGLN